MFSAGPAGVAAAFRRLITTDMTALAAGSLNAFRISDNVSISSVRDPATSHRSIYLDLQATTPMDPRVLDSMMPCLTEQFGNPHSRTHLYGWETQDAVEEARTHIAQLVGASDSKEIIFTSGATESNNAALKGLAGFYGSKKRHFITTQIEHKCVLDTCRSLQQHGFDVTYLPVDKEGLLDLQQLRAAIRPNETLAVSIMAVNNEIGALQQMEEIGKICRQHKVFFHTDAAQAVGKIDVDVEKWQVDLMSISSHKIYGPKGIGALYVRRKPRVRLEPLINGGGQERGLRSGTLAPSLVVGFGEACRVAIQELPRDKKHVQRLYDRLLQRMSERVPNIQINGPTDVEKRYAGCLNISFAYVEGESLLMALKDIAVSSGSACTSASLEPSYVLRALGLEDELAHTSIRFGMGRFTTEREIDYAVDLCAREVSRLRELSPLWEMVQEGIDLKTIQWSGH